ncbi:hypothetical protein KEM52_003241, partial [Ascosphaera acerosa]
LARVVRKGFGWDKFPALTALLAASATVVPELVEGGLFRGRRRRGATSSSSSPSPSPAARASAPLTFVSVFLAAGLFWPLLNRRPPPPLRRQQTAASPDCAPTVCAPDSGGNNTSTDGTLLDTAGLQPRDLSGRTLDLTLACVARAADVLCCLLWARYLRSRRRGDRNRDTSTLALAAARLVPQLATCGAFASASALIMWAWFYSPERLPASYRSWITSAAQVDERLIDALRGRRRGYWAYGRPAPRAAAAPSSAAAGGAFPPRLDDLAEALGLPRAWGDPAKTVPFPCEIVHMRHGGASCELHALWRFATGFRFAFAMYFPLQVLMQLRRAGRFFGRPRSSVPSAATATALSLRLVLRMARTAARSSAFLGAFIALFFYAVCLARTRVGPRLFPYPDDGDKSKNKDAGLVLGPDFWDGGACVGAGCALCGWSILLESARKRIELALFVAPRGLAVLLPRRYPNKYRAREQLAFALSLAILLTAVRAQPSLVRGVLGRILSGVLR